MIAIRQFNNSTFPSQFLVIDNGKVVDSFLKINNARRKAKSLLEFC